MPPDDGLTRRAILGSATLGVFSGMAGCLQADNGNGDPPEPVQVTIRAPPSDEDPMAAEIARRLSENLSTAGIEASLVTRIGERFYEDVHIERSFDIIVAQLPRIDDPDDLRPLFHSTFAEGIGEWLNPFGFADATTDELLTDQLDQEGADRIDTINDLQWHLAAEVTPVSVVTAPDELTAVDDALPVNARPTGFETAEDVLSLGHPGGDGSPALTVAVLDPAVTEFLNPLTGSAVGQPVVSGLIYDSLVRRLHGSLRNWMASDIAWSVDDDTPTATISLRDNLSWHDGEPVTLEDVAFTFEFLSDLSDDADAMPRPAARYAAAMSRIDSFETTDDGTFVVQFSAVTQPLAQQSLTVPILPEHEWAETAGISDSVPQPLTEPNHDAIGSGPFRLEELDTGQQLVLSANEEHFTDAQAPVSVTPIQTLTLTVPSHPPTVGLAIDLIENGDIDAIARVPPSEVSPVINADAVDLQLRPSRRPYVIGFNTTDGPTADVAFRQAVARSLDRTFIVGSVFRGFAEAADSLLARTIFESNQLRWDEQSVIGPFPGTSDVVNESAIRSIFADAGYPFDEDAEVIYREE